MSGSYNMDFFHLGLLLVMVMVLITAIVLCVAIAGLCCFHCLEKTGNSPAGGGEKAATPTQMRDEIWRLDVELGEYLRNQQTRKKSNPQPHPQHPPPPTYEQLFPADPLPPYTPPQFPLFV